MAASVEYELGSRCSWACAIRALPTAGILALHTISGIQMFALCPFPTLFLNVLGSF